jgi:2',3'-cyclic-nucleotide 2'-phosphodiesterase (5'-nucleotidase family)
VPRLRILSFNDVYSLENLPRMATLVRTLRAAGRDERTLVVLAGDFLAPSLLSSLDGGRGMVECLNAVGVDVVVLGNHEDDVPHAELVARLAELRARGLAANVHGFEPELAASEIVELGGGPGERSVRVGLVGALMADPAVYRRAPFGGARLEDAAEAVLREVERLLALGCTSVVPITHQDADDDRALARRAADRPIPVVVGGHEHSPLLEHVGPVWLVKAGMDATHAAVIDLTWSPRAPLAGPDRPVVSARLEPVVGYPEDSFVRTLVDKHMVKVHALEAATLLPIPAGQELSSAGIRARPTTLGTLVCSLLRDAMRAEACVFNGGGIRASRTYAGRFTYADLEAEMPFDNEVVVVRLPGRVLRDAVAVSRAKAPAESGGYLQVDDRMAVEEPGHRVVAVAGEAIDDARLYEVALVRELLLGMDHVGPLVAWARDNPAAVPPEDTGRGVRGIMVEAFARVLWRKLGGFDAVDANHDGQVTRDEIAAAVGRATGGASSPAAADLVLGAIDVKRQGVITPDELDPDT